MPLDDPLLTRQGEFNFNMPLIMSVEETLEPIEIITPNYLLPRKL